MDLKVSTRIGVGAVLALALVAMMAGTDASRARNSDASIVTQWNELAIHAPIGPIEAMSYVALMQLAIYDAVMAVEGGYEPFAYTGPTNPNASAEAAAATAAHRVVVQLLPGVAADAEALYATQMSAIPDGAAKTDGVAIGEAAAAVIIALPLGSQIVPGGPYTPVNDPGGTPDNPSPGVWVPTSPSPPIATWAPNATPLTFPNASQFRPGPPPSLDSEAWVMAFNEVRDYGGADSTLRSPEQTETALYYAEQPAHQPHKSFRRFIAERNLDLVEASRYLAMVSSGMSDALIACFEAKYYYQFWRPIQSVPGDDGNPLTQSDPDWNIAIPGTPNHPEYPAAHSCATSTWSLITARYLGTDQINFYGETTVDGRGPRFWPTVQDALDDVANGRIWGGVHYRFSTVAGAGIANHVVDNLMANHFQATQSSPSPTANPPAPMPPRTGSGLADGGPIARWWVAVLATAVILGGGWFVATRGRRIG